MSRGWTCQRRKGGVKCGHRNPSRKRKCVACGGAKPARRSPAHMAALELDYQGFVELNGGDFCAICGQLPTRRRLDRDHDHSTGSARGLLCHRCNRALPRWVTPEWLRTAASYLERKEAA